MGEYLRSIRSASTLNPLGDGTAYNFEELWDNVIYPNLPAEETVRAWHKLLLDYVNSDDAVFILRSFGSYPNRSSNSAVLRRGFLNVVNNQMWVVYVDIFFTQFFYSMAKDGFVPTLGEFKIFMRNRQFPCGTIQTRTEKAKAAFKSQKGSDVSKKGYKIAHLYSSGEHFDRECGWVKKGDFCNQYFPRGDYNDWNCIGSDENGQYYYRNIEVENTESIRRFLVAHFMRTVHPMNYFLVPNKPGRDKNTGIMRTNIYYTIDGVEKDEIGEEKKLISYVREKIKCKYRDIFDEFHDIILPDDTFFPEPDNCIINAEYGIDLWRRRIIDSGESSISTHETQNNEPRNTLSERQAEHFYLLPQYSSYKVGKLANTVLRNALENGKATADEISCMQTLEYSNEHFGINYPLLVSDRNEGNAIRYYSNPLTIYDHTYYMCSQWFETEANNDRPLLESWLLSHSCE